MLRVLEVPETVPALEHTALSTLCGLSTGCQARAPLIGISGTGEGHVAHISGQWIKDNSNPNWRNAKKLQEAISERSSTVVSNSLWPHCLPRCLCPWNSPGKSTGMSCRFLLQGLFLTQRLNLGLLHCRQILYCLSHDVKWKQRKHGYFYFTHTHTHIIHIAGRMHQ